MNGPASLSFDRPEALAYNRRMKELVLKAFEESADASSWWPD